VSIDLVSIDLRSPEDHRGGRIPAARSVPLEELRRRWTEVPRQRVVVLYCACATQTIDVAYYFLRRQGCEEVFVLTDGVEAWTARGTRSSGNGRRSSGVDDVYFRSFLTYA
jgi:rhodanese-related sulfurtransferase